MSRGVSLVAWATLLACVAFPGRAASQDPESGRQPDVRRTSLGADYSYAYFHGDLDPWQLAAVSVGRRDTRGSLIGRVNVAQRFGESGVQLEVDAYPRIRPGMYAYLNAGYSADDIFPAWRSGAELFTNLPRAWEASVGYRQVRFSGTPVTLFTGALGKYIGNSWISARPYVRFKDEGASASLGLTGRKYFADADNYLGARVSAGSSPTERGDATELARTQAWSAGLQASRTLRPRITGTASVGIEREELGIATRRRVDLSVGIRKDF